MEAVLGYLGGIVVAVGGGASPSLTDDGISIPFKFFFPSLDRIPLRRLTALIIGRTAM